MSRTRSQANQSLYRARILLAAWEREREAGRLADKVLIGAFLPAVRLHLRESYGWFLLAVSGAETSELDTPPQSVAELEAPEAGKVRAPELRELELLEETGWLADVLRDSEVRQDAVAAASVLVSDQELPGLAVASRWADQWAEIMSRMNDSLDEC